MYWLQRKYMGEQNIYVLRLRAEAINRSYNLQVTEQSYCGYLRAIYNISYIKATCSTQQVYSSTKNVNYNRFRIYAINLTKIETFYKRDSCVCKSLLLFVSQKTLTCDTRIGNTYPDIPRDIVRSPYMEINWVLQLK